MNPTPILLSTITLAVLLVACGHRNDTGSGGDRGTFPSTASVACNGSGGSGGAVGPGGSTTGSGASSSTGGGGSGPGVACAPTENGAVGDYYVDGSCANDGDGTADQCAASPGGPGAFRDPQSCFSAAGAGQTCLIKDGTYVSTNNGGDPNENGGFSVINSGSPGSPIVFRNYPGHAPLLANCDPASTSYCRRPTITAHDRSNVVFQGLRIHGGFSIFGDTDQRGIVIQNCDITQGWGEVDDGNWAAVRLENQLGAVVRCNDIHDLSVQSGGGQQSSGACVKLYQNTGSTIEYNTCKHVLIPESQAGGIDDKAQATDNVIRYNWVEDVASCVRVNNQLQSSGDQVYHNVCIGQGDGTGTDIGIRLIIDIHGVDIYNNTVQGFGVGMMIMSEGGPVEDDRTYNNIFSGVVDNNLEAYQGPAFADFNAYSPGASSPSYLVGGHWYGSVDELRAATGIGAHSIEVDCGFVSPGDFHLGAGSPCRGVGRVGGTSSGAPVDVGAYADGIDCVGHGC